MVFSIGVSELVAFLALGVAVWSVIQNRRFNRRQNEFAETAERLNHLLIEREASDKKQQIRADLSADFVKTGKSSYRLKVFNRGAASARNVRLELLSGKDLITDHELEQKFPFPLLERQQHVDVMVRLHMQSSRRAQMRITWDDDSGDSRASEIWRDVF